MSESKKGFYIDIKLAQVYILMQMYGETFEIRTALRNGTLFPELYRPFPPQTFQE
ncbi:spore coat associated protein CotJA [Thermovenabulum gondwanense]|uniref:Spore coat associated protein JA (CotJA) n=1 Tax=Thermovenabulum gondwanense TaxID=520767 RepID=A0A161QA03_9FIRM|nr:spore coat associated protein CotJA [Thermovenabulum gondwanense]KYO64786.1 hypothetical protein ATZ99_18440 [Thermovenabulum gondwanense]